MCYSYQRIHICKIDYNEVKARINDLGLNTCHMYLILVVTYDYIFTSSLQ